MPSRITYILPILTLTGCVTLNPSLPDLSPDECFAHGVAVDFNTGPMLPVLSEVGTTLGGVAKRCEVPGNYFWTVTGCIKPEGDGYTVIYSDGATKIHEYCHALHGRNHARAPWMGRKWGAERRCGAFGKEAEFDGEHWRCK